MRRLYPAVIDRDGDVYGISLPDFPGCVSSADTAEGAIAGIEEALAGHVALMVEDGDAIPDPTPLDKVTWQPDEGVICVTLVAVVIPSRLRRYNVCLDEGLVAEIDRRFGNRSRFLAEAARAELARRPDVEARP
ncbi:type II toxin-antitoxin system HicB family antitoxin [Novispirillum sp. DQ9]|uniref:type II toxin-antitoxin system HicB family antitoxin n=1 Tax=Novispirillum sp. DQ9 TaxID=3398612 RepID=UPI003C7CFFD0